jgi:hypothetical protein
MCTGLKKAWGLKDPKAPPSTAQADEFKASYQAILNKINAALQYTVVNAEKPKHEAKVASRDQLNTNYQAVLAQIDPSNPAVAKSAIQSALATANTTSNDICAFKSEVEKAVAAWQSNEPTFEHTITLIEELEAWGDAKAPELRAEATKIQELANNKSFMPAVDATVALVVRIKPIYENYLKQKAAKEKYEPILAALEPRLEATKKSTFKKLEPQQASTATHNEKMRQSATEKDYVSALALLEALEEFVSTYEKDLAKLEEQKKAYEQELEKLKPKLEETSKCDYEKLAPMHEEIVTLKGQMESSAEGEDFEQALKTAQGLSAKVDEYKKALEELEQKKKQYEEAMTPLQPKLDKAVETKAKNKSIAAMQDEITTIKTDMDAQAKSGDYDLALKSVTDLSAKVDACQKAQDDLVKQKQAYEDALNTLKPKLEEAAKYHGADGSTEESDIAQAKQQMETAAQEEEFEQATKLATDLATKVDAFVAEQKKIEAEYPGVLSAAQKAFADLKGHKQAANFTKEIAAVEKTITDGKSNGDARKFDDANSVLRPVPSTCSQITITMELVAKGLTRARADEEADVAQSLIDQGVDREKALEVGKTMKVGGHGDRDDEKIVAAELAKLPIEVVQEMNKNGTKVVACRDSVTDYKTDLKGEKPRGWKKGDTWDTVPGCHDPKSKEVIIATRGHGTPEGPSVPQPGNGHGSYNLVTHEAMHGHDDDGKPPKHDDAAFQAARKKDFKKLDPYLQQGDEAGLEETYAESAARYYSGDPTFKDDCPELYKYWESKKKK